MGLGNIGGPGEPDRIQPIKTIKKAGDATSKPKEEKGQKEQKGVEERDIGEKTTTSDDQIDPGRYDETGKKIERIMDPDEDVDFTA